MFVIVQSKFFFPPFFKHLDHFFSLISFLNKFQNVSPRQRKDTSETRRYEIFESFSLARIFFFFSGHRSKAWFVTIVFYSNRTVGVARISRMHRWVFCKPRNPWLDFQKKYDPCLRVLVTRAREANETHLEKEFHPNGGRRGISIRKLEAHFRIVYFGAWWTRHTRGAGPIMRFHRPFAFESIVSKRVQRFPDVAFSSITGLVTPRFFSISKLRKNPWKHSIRFFLINLRITCDSPLIRWILFLLSIVYFFFFKFKRDEIFFDHSFESNSILTASRSTCTFDGYCFDRFQLSIVFSRFLKKTRDFSMIRVKFLAALEFLLRFDGYSIVLDCLLFF